MLSLILLMTCVFIPDLSARNHRPCKVTKVYHYHQRPRTTFNVGFGATPGYYENAYVATQPVYYQPAPVVVQQPVYAPGPVYVQQPAYAPYYQERVIVERPAQRVSVFPQFSFSWSR